MRSILIFPLIKIIKFYQILISPHLGSNCKFYPTCSNYAIEALRKYGFFKGLYLSVYRILKCNPWSKNCGCDPVPD